MPRQFHTEVDLRAGLLLAGSAGVAGDVPTSNGPGSLPAWKPLALFVPCEILIVGGGGTSPSATAAGSASGGSGGGEVEFLTGIGVLRGVSLPVTVGAAGNQSSFGPLTAAAGSDGGAPGSNGNGSASAGSGGGGGTTGTATTGGIGGSEVSNSTVYLISSNALPERNSYSKAGGAGSAGTISANRASGGGGGAGGVGGDGINGNPPTRGAGGAGISLSITGSAVTYGAGGAGGGTDANRNGSNGTANTGNGGGGASRNTVGTSTGGTGGSGVVIIAYPDTYPVPTAITGTYNEPARTGWRVYRFTGSGSITL